MGKQLAAAGRPFKSLDNRYDTESVDRYIDGLPPRLTIKKACEVAAASQSKMYELMGDKKVRAVKMDGRTLIDTKSLLKFIHSLPDAEIIQPKRRRVAAQDGQEARVQPLASEAARSSRGVDKRTGKAGRRRDEAVAGA